MSWFALVPAIASCAEHYDPLLCGDDVGVLEGLEVHLSGAAETETYDIDIVADGTPISLTQPPGGSDEVEITFEDGTRLRAVVRYTEIAPDPQASLLSLVYDRPPDESAWGPTTAQITVTMQGEAVEQTFTPVYDVNDRGWPEGCRGAEHSFVVMGVPTP